MLGQNYFNNDGLQNYLIFQPIHKTVIRISGVTGKISESKELSNEKITPSYKANKSLSPKLAWINDSRIRLEF